MRQYVYSFVVGGAILMVFLLLSLTKFTMDDLVQALPIRTSHTRTKDDLTEGPPWLRQRVRSSSERPGDTSEASAEEGPHRVSNMRVRPTSLPNKTLPSSMSKCRRHIRNGTTIKDLLNILQQWAQSEYKQCRGLYALFLQHFHVQWRTGELRLPAPFEKMFNWLGRSLSALRQAKNQTIIFINNKLTSEGVIINPLRQKRPKSSKFPLSEYQYATKLSHDTASSCDFCRYSNFTAHDVFGRLESKYAFTAANAFKLDQWHGLIVFRDHHPLRWTLQHFKDAFELSNRWYLAAQAFSPSYLYRYMTWDLLPASGSSQIHPHLHLFLSPTLYGHPSQWYSVAEEYKQTHPGRDYFQDLILIHTQLKLDVKHGDATALVYLTPVRNNGLLVIAPAVNTKFVELVFFMLRAYIDKLQECSFSMVIAHPASSGPHSRMPAMAWMVSRGSNQDVRSDITSMEMFASSNIDIDFFQLARGLREFKSDQLTHNSSIT